LEQYVGAEGAAAIQTMVAATAKPKAGTIATVLGIAALLFGATGFFAQLKDALNTIWEAAPSNLSFLGMVKDRALSFLMVLAIAALLILSLAATTVVGRLTSAVDQMLPLPSAAIWAIDAGVSLGITTLLFAIVFRFLPDADVAWRDVWIGGLVTAVLFGIGRYAFGFYLAHAAVSSTYGAAGSLVAFMLWAYYSAQILFLGAEFTQAYQRMYGSKSAA